MSFVAGEVLYISQQDPSGWWEGVKEDGTKGWIPGESVYCALFATANIRVPSYVSAPAVKKKVIISCCYSGNAPNEAGDGSAAKNTFVSSRKKPTAMWLLVVLALASAAPSRPRALSAGAVGSGGECHGSSLCASHRLLSQAPLRFRLVWLQSAARCFLFDFPERCSWAEWRRTASECHAPNRRSGRRAAQRVGGCGACRARRQAAAD
jgi:hypothetical protein